MLADRYIIEEHRIANLHLDKDADLLHPVFGEGNETDPYIMFIGEAPGKEEAACGRPFVGKAGKQLDAMLELAGIDRSSVFVTNTVKYRPIKRKGESVSNRTPTSDEILNGLELLRYEIDAVHPLVIATLGNVPLSAVRILAQRVYGEQTIGAVHGRPTSYFIGSEARKVFPLYHPAAAIYNRELKPVLEEDLKRLGDLVRSFGLN